MDQEVKDYFENLPEWQKDICAELRTAVLDVIPQVTERLQYGKPHYLKNGHYAGVIHAAKDKLSFMIFNAGGLEEIKGVFKSMSSPDRKTITIKEGQKIDYELIKSLFAKASCGL